MREIEYKDADGCKYLVLLPDDAPDEHAALGVRLGPPNLDDLGLRQEVKVRLNNELYNRRIITKRDAYNKMGEVISALQAALKVDAMRVLDLYGVS